MAIFFTLIANKEATQYSRTTKTWSPEEIFIIFILHLRAVY